MKMKAEKSSAQGFHLRSILIHSAWMTALGMVLFRLATANTQQVIYVEIFAISGTIFATVPWVVQLLASMAIILAYNSGTCNLTGLIRPPSKDGSCSPNLTAGDQDIENGAVGTGAGGNEQGSMLKHARNFVGNGLGFNMPLQVEEIKGPKLQRNRTV
ncbi:unnamed protein product [Ilex paraguariensis]|uniref:Uncharacterized protein n=1 Tax=Ilex paraguariensis TaxID=185542 RepID=A0ABC8U3F6_9AQUA